MKKLLNEILTSWWVEAGLHLSNPKSNESVEALKKVLREDFRFENEVISYLVERLTNSPTNFHLGGKSSGINVGDNQTAVSAKLHPDWDEGDDNDEDDIFADGGIMEWDVTLMDGLDELNEADQFTAIKNDTKNRTVFRSQQAKDAAIKAGTHSDVDKGKGDTPTDGTDEEETPEEKAKKEKEQQKADEPEFDKSAIKGMMTQAERDADKEKQAAKKVKKQSDDTPKTSTKNKTLKPDVSQKPESFSKDNPTDDEFEKKVKEGIIKPQKYKQQTIEVNGNTYNQPLSYEDVDSFFQNSKDKIPPKYIKTLQRILNSKQESSSTPAISEFLNGAGAGEIPAQSGEILTFMLTSMDEESAKQLGDLLLATAKNQKGKSILDESWIDASISSRETILRQVKEKYGEDAEIEFGAWDTQDDVENGIGLENYSENKGFSTDVYFRVKTSDGPKIHEVSLKKDFEAYFANLGSTDIEKVLESAGAKLYDSDEDREKNSVGNLTKNQAKNSVKRVREVTQDSVDEILNQSDDELIKNAEKLPPGIRSLVLSGDSKKGYTLSPEIKKYKEFLSKIKDKYPLPWDKTTLQNPDFFKQSKALGIDLGAKAPTQKGISKLMVFTNYMLYTNELSKGEKGPSFEFLNQQLGLDNDPPEGSAKYVANKHIENLAKPEAREALMGIIGEKFPLKTLLSGEESMVLGNQSLDTETCKQIFGTNNYDEIQEGISVEVDEEGNKFLSYTAKSSGAKPIKIAEVECRQRGQGYAAPTTGIAPTDEFKHRIYCSNKDKIETYSSKEENAAKSLIKKFGKCGSTSYD